MKIETRDFGTMEVSENQLITFPDGLYAFEDSKHFALIAPNENRYPMWLQCTDSLKPCFIVFDPQLFAKDYEVSLGEGEKAILKIKEDSELKVLCIAHVPDDFRDTTVNMRSPIVINMDNRLAMQIILPHDYPYRHPIYQKTEQEA